MIYLEDLSSVVLDVVELAPETKYILAVDDAKSTLKDVARVTNICYILFLIFTGYQHNTGKWKSQRSFERRSSLTF